MHNLVVPSVPVVNAPCSFIMASSCARFSGGNRDKLFCICDIAPAIWDVVSRPSMTCLTTRDSHSPGFKPNPAARPLTAMNAVTVVNTTKITMNCLRMTLSPARSEGEEYATAHGERTFDVETADRRDCAPAHPLPGAAVLTSK